MPPAQPRSRATVYLAYLFAVTLAPGASKYTTHLNELPLRSTADFSEQGWGKTWAFSNGPEFTGASGALSRGPGPTGGAILSFSFSCEKTGECGHYVAAIWKLPAPVTAKNAVLIVQAELPPTISLKVRVQDRTGQTLQYSPIMSLEGKYSPSPNTSQIDIPLWHPAEVHWGGLNNGVINDRINQVWLCANNESAIESVGQVILSSAEIVEITEASVDVSADSAEPANQNGSPELRPLIGVSTHDLTDQAGLDAAAAAGFSFIRCDIFWDSLEQQGTYQFGPYDRAFAEIRRRKMGVLWVLGYGHRNHGGRIPKSEEDRLAFARYAAAVAAHFAGPGVRFEVWNEPDGETLGNESTDGDLLRRSLRAMLAVAPNAEVGTGGVWIGRHAFISSLLESAAVEGAKGLSVHPYRDKPESVGDDLNKIRILERKTGKPLPLWDTEWGYSSHPKASNIDGHGSEARNRQAVLCTREFLSAWAVGFKLIVWYDLRDDNYNPLDPEGNFGLLDKDSRAKPSFTDLRTLCKTAEGHRNVGLLKNLPIGAHAMRLEGTNDVTLVVWVDEPTISYSIRANALHLISISDVNGTQQSGHETNNDFATFPVTESQGPVYIRYQKP